MCSENVQVFEIKEVQKDKEKYWPQILTIFILSLGFFTNGLLLTWSSPYAMVIVEDKDNYNITEEEASYFITFNPLGMIFASLFYFKISEYLGRKKSLISLAVPQTFSWIIIIFATNKWHFYVARFIGGMAETVLFCSIPPYIGEVTSPTVRGYFGNIPMFSLNLGTVAISILGIYLNVKPSAYICLSVPLLFLLLVALVLPESPYQLIKDLQYTKAHETIRWFRRKPDVEDDFIKMKADVERQISESGNWKDLYKIASNRKALRAGIFLRFSQQFCGIAVFYSFIQSIFEKAGGNLSAQNSSLIFISTVCILNLLCSAVIEKFGRKATYFYSILSCGIILILMSIYFALEQYQLANLEQFNWFPLVGMLSFVLAFSPGLGIVPTLMLAELFSASVKSKCLSLLMAAFGISVLLTTNIFIFLTSYVGLFCPFLVYGINCVISSVFTLRWVPETKGKTLEEIQQELKK
ncbi:unnamed protein product [Ceutorhynchus assimilis]|uniref:Major facilitator superfamily (MFS) profile domain-containing protein n=1 Tax=Ceutorhynchus assimilis TaxID=467358 RepID=A0A9N9MLR1_9CUCU|nr:unnamed protein product [Ceutorhynchus assimilis]